MSKPRVVIDAGHYGKYNRSPAVKSYYESDMTWKLSMLQKKYLEQYGIEVKLTRSDKDKDLALYNRGAASKGADLFLSNHSNAVGSGVNESVDYVAVYHLTDDTTTKVDDISKEIAQRIAPVIATTMGVKQGSKTLSRLASSDKNKDGILNDNYYGVLNGARQVGTPGLILEHSFHTNTKATKWLLDDANLDKLAQAEAKVIADYFGSTKQNQPVAKTESCAVNVAMLQKGSKGASVKALQLLLIGNDFSCGSYGADGDFGSATDKAVREYQKAKGLAVDGIVGVNTWSKLLGM